MNAVDTLASPPLFTALAAVFGLIIGSFLNVVIHRLPKMMEREWQAECAALRGEVLPPAPRYDLVAPRSACPACGHQETETMPMDFCRYFYDCKGCGILLKPKAGDCCVFCSYGSVPCPPVQQDRSGQQAASCCEPAGRG